MKTDKEGPLITEVETIPLFLPFRKAYSFSVGTRLGVEVLLVRIRASDGTFGIGETQAWRRRGTAATLPNIVQKIRVHLAPLLIGRSPREILPIVASMDRALDRSMYAKAAITDALYDLAGKMVGVPAYRLMGGRCREALGAGAVVPIKPDIQATLENARERYDLGYRSLTIKIGRDLAQDYRVVKALRENLGEEVTLRVDANAALPFDHALRLLKRLEPFDLDAAEQPLAPWDLQGLAELARRVETPIMVDESLLTPHDLVNVIRERAASVIQTKQAKNGGLFTVRRIWTLADTAGIRIYPGNHPSTSVATAAVLQLAAAWPGELLEGSFAAGVTDLLEHDVVENSLKVRNAEVRIPEGPGLGVTLDEDAVAHFRLDLERTKLMSGTLHAANTEPAAVDGSPEQRPSTAAE